MEIYSKYSYCDFLPCLKELKEVLVADNEDKSAVLKKYAAEAFHSVSKLIKNVAYCCLLDCSKR